MAIFYPLKEQLIRLLGASDNSIGYGVDVKPLAATIGHTSVETTLNVYSHATEEMQRAAANKIEQTIGTVTGV